MEHKKFKILKELTDLIAEINKAEGKDKDSKKKELMKYIMAAKKNISLLRQEIQSVPDNEKIKWISIIDPLLVLPVLRKIVDDIKQNNEVELLRAYETYIGRTTLDNNNNKNPFKEFIVKDIKQKFDQYVKYESADITDEETKKIMDEYSQHLKTLTINPFVTDREQQLTHLTQLLFNHIFLTLAQHCYATSDAQQNKNIGVLAIEFFTKEAKDIRNPFIILQQCARYIVVSDKDKVLWSEFSAWLGGLYGFGYKQVPEQLKKENEILKDERGLYPAIDDLDSKMRDKLGVTKIEIFLYHLHTAMQIDSAVKQYAESAALMAKQEKIVEKPAKIIPTIKRIDSGANIKFLITLPPDQEKADLLFQYLLEILNERKQILTVNMFRDKLQKVAYEDFDRKMDELAACFEADIIPYPILQEIKFILVKVEKICSNYLKNDGSLFGYISSNGHYRRHAADAKHMLELAKKEDVLGLMKCLLQKRIQLSGGPDESQYLLPSIKKVLHSVFDVMRSGAEKEIENKDEVKIDDNNKMSYNMSC